MADIEKFVYYSNGSKKVLKPTDRMVIGSGGFAFEGGTSDDFETELAVADPTADRTITFPDSSGNVVLSDSSGHVSLNDNAKLKLGTSGDLEIFHDGSNSIIKDTAVSGGSTIKYLAGTQTFQNKDANKTIAVFNAAGSVDLHHNGTKKFETTSSGIQTSGTISVNGVYTLPTSDGTSSQVLTTDGSGTVSFQDVSGGGGISNIVEDTTPQLGGNLDPNGFGVSNHLLPSAVDTYDLGSGTAEWRNLHLGDYSSIYFGNDIETQLRHIPDTGLFLYIGSGTGLAVDRPDFSLYNAANVTSGPVFDVKKSSAHIAVDDTVGKIQMSTGGTTTPSTDIIYSEISTSVLVKDASSEEGSLKIKVSASGALTTSAMTSATASAASSISVLLRLRVMTWTTTWTTTNTAPTKKNKTPTSKKNTTPTSKWMWR